MITKTQARLQDRILRLRTRKHTRMEHTYTYTHKPIIEFDVFMQHGKRIHTPLRLHLAAASGPSIRKCLTSDR